MWVVSKGRLKIINLCGLENYNRRYVCMSHSQSYYHRPFDFDFTEDDLYDDDQPWTENAAVLVWPLHNIFRISPLQPHLTDNERLNAHARLTLLLGLTLAYYLHQRDMDYAPVVFWTLYYVMNQGVEYMTAHAHQLRRVETDRAVRGRFAEVSTRVHPPQTPPTILPPSQPPRQSTTLQDRWQLNYGSRYAPIF
jgi:hypothetical protein